MSNTLTEWFRHVPEEKWLRDPAASRADAQAIWEKLELKAGVRVFECPCGKADLSFPLARLGANVSGIDFNSHFVSAAKNKFSRAGLAGEFKTDDMRTAQFPEQMDLIINWASSFGYFSDKDNADLLARLPRAWSKADVFLSKWLILRVFWPVKPPASSLPANRFARRGTLNPSALPSSSLPRSSAVRCRQASAFTRATNTVQCWRLQASSSWTSTVRALRNSLPTAPV